MAGLNTGIQRVVRSLVTRLPAISRVLEVPCVPVFAKGGRLWVLEAPDALARAGRPGWVGRARDRFVRVEAAFERLVSRRLAHRPALQRLALATWGAPRQALKWAMRLLTRGRAARGGRLTAVRPGPDDVLLLSDVYWTSDIVTTLEAGAAGGALIVPVIYDLIPLTHPQFFAPHMVQEFQAAFERLMALAGAVLADSRATRAEVEAWLKTHAGRRVAAPPMDIAYCGADLPPVGGPVRPEVLALQGAEYYLMVGTLEPRKGQLIALEAFETLWRAADPVRLVLAGRIGWRCEEILQRIEDSPHTGTRLLALYNASDAEVDWLYRHAAAVILASSVEGFGLPLVEAMRLGTPVIASDIPVFREVGGDYPLYFPLGQPGALNEALTSLRERLRSGWRPTPRPWPTWDEAALAMIGKVLELRERVRRAES
jgi:alpha-1,2-rhamnosyltransferase